MAVGKGRVLVVDDSEDDQLFLRNALESEFQVLTAFSAAQALEFLSRDRVDVLLTDQRMPRMSGDALIRRIKSTPATADTRCILLSGKTSPQALVDILKSGHIFHYFEKDKTLLTDDGRAELILAVRNAVAASRLEAERTGLNRRLRSQVDALSGQYRLLRSLFDIKDSSSALRLVADSLARQLSCRAVIGILDLSPDQGVLGHVGLASGVSISEGDMRAWQSWGEGEYEHLSGRTVGAVAYSSGSANLDASIVPIPVEDDVPTLPIFVNRDLRGLLVLVGAPEAAYPPEELELLEVWRDQLQDALTRLHTRMLDEQRRIELMVEAMEEGVVLTDENGAVTLMNPAARRMLGLEELDRPDFSVVIDALGLSSLDVLRQLGVGDNKAAWRALRRGEHFFEVLCSPVRDHAAVSVGILTVIRDVTAQRNAENQREEFVHIIGHELRSPLTSIGGVMDLLDRGVLGALTGRQREYIGMARTSAEKINAILNDLLDLAKFEQGKMPLSPSLLAIDELVEREVRGFEALALERGVELIFECPVAGLYCQADPHRVGQVLSNLLSNAFKYAPAGGQVKVSVFTGFAVDDMYLVCVSNNGTELAEADLERIFEKFEQAPGRPGRGRKGTGLGLSICRNIIEGHRGRIWAESGRGEGTTFAFSIPAAIEGDGETTLFGEQTPKTARGRGGEVLLTCRDSQEGLALKALLIDLGYRVRLVSATVDAVTSAVAARTPTFAAYLDVDGVFEREVLEELTSHNQLPVVAMTPPGAMPPVAVDLNIDLPPDPLVLASTLNVFLARQRRRRRMRILVVDSDAGWAAALSEHLETGGYLAYVAVDAATAIRRVETLLPDLVILDRHMPDWARVREHLSARAEAAIPVLYTDADTAQSDGRSVARDALPREVLLQIRGVLARDPGGLDSLLVLPGSRELQREMKTRIRENQGFTYIVIDFVGLRHAVEAYGFMWGHGVVAHSAELIHQVLREHANERAFLGHRRDDDFVVVVSPTHGDTVCAELERAFERLDPILAAGEGENAHVRLELTAIIDPGGALSRFTEVQDAIEQVREAFPDKSLRVHTLKVD